MWAKMGNGIAKIGKSKADSKDFVQDTDVIEMRKKIKEMELERQYLLDIQATKLNAKQNILDLEAEIYRVKRNNEKETRKYQKHIEKDKLIIEHLQNLLNK